MHSVWQGWPDAYQVDTSEQCHVCTIQPRPGADILPDCDDPSFVERESATLRLVQDLVRFLLRPAPATASGSDPGLHETLDACADLTDRLVYVHPMFCMLLRRRTSSPGTRLAFRLSDPRCSDCQRDFQLRTPVRVKTKRVARTWVNKIPPIQHLSCSHPLSPAGLYQMTWIWRPWTDGVVETVSWLGLYCMRRDGPFVSISTMQLWKLPQSHSGPNSGGRHPLTQACLKFPLRTAGICYTQSAGVRVESGSHLLSGPNSTHKVGNGKPWQELQNLLLTVGTVHWNSSPHETASSPSIADPQADLPACTCITRETPIDGWVQTQPDCASQPRQGNASTRGKMMLSLHSAWWVLRPTLPTELRFLFLTKHGVPLRLILLLAPALQHLTRPYTCSLPLARLPTQAAHSFSVPHRGSFHGNTQAGASI